MSDRDLVGYGGRPPQARWPGGARLALSFVLNLEEGAERTPLLGDETAEAYGTGFPLAPKPAGVRSLSAESLFEYGSRAGFWRLAGLFDARGWPLTVFACGLALERNPAIAGYLRDSRHEVAGHGWRWIDYTSVVPEVEREHIVKTVEAIARLTGQRPAGWYTGRRSARTRELLIEHGGFLYDSEGYADDLPYYVNVRDKPHLVVPYTLDCNDFRFSTNPGFACSEDFSAELKGSFDALYREGEAAPKLMSVGLHGRLGGRPARAGALNRFLDHVAEHEDVWIARRDAIARHWQETRPHKRDA